MLWKTVKASKKLLYYDFYRRSYSPSNGAIANVVLRDLDLHFQDQILLSAKTVRASVKMCAMTFKEVGICNVVYRF